MSSTYEQIKHLPKAELHVHLDGCIRPETMLDLADQQGLNLPARDARTLANQLFVGDAESLEQYLSNYDITLSVMQTKSALERIAYEFIEDSAEHHTRYVEVRYCPALHRQNGMSLSDAIEAPLEGLRRGSKETGVKFGLIVCGLRTLSPRISKDLSRAAVDYSKDGVAAFDLAGSEAGYPAQDHVAAFEHALGHGLPCTCHAGEGDGPDSIWQALHVCQAHRVGHGTRLHESPELEEYVRAEQIPLEICLSSNRHTHTVPDVTTHPIRRYFDIGCLVTLNTDSRLMDATTITDEYVLAHQQLGFSLDELKQIALNGFKAAFLPEAEKDELIAEVKEQLGT